MRRSRVRQVLFALALTVCGRVVVADPDAPIADRKLEEHLEVRLVTIDVIALDGQDRTVPNLGKEAFRLLVDGNETPIDTLDVRCGDAPEPDPKSKRFGDWKSPPDLADGTRRVVLALDYLHLPTVWCPDLQPPGPCMLHTQVLQAYRAAIAAKPEIGDEEMMIVALTGGLRVEQPFTRDRGAIVAALRRMEYDVTLWNGRFEHGTEYGLFRGLGALATLLRATPGPKSIIFLTAGGGPGTGYDLEFAKLATLASDAQARIYPVDCRGLFMGTLGRAPPRAHGLATPRASCASLRRPEGVSPKTRTISPWGTRGRAATWAAATRSAFTIARRTRTRRTGCASEARFPA
jgi:VWFA-related protein